MLLPYIGTVVHINSESPMKLDDALLVAVNSDTFAVTARGSRTRRHYPFRYILSIAEVTEDETTAEKTLQIEVFRQVFVRGAVSVGMSIPL